MQDVFFPRNSTLGYKYSLEIKRKEKKIINFQPLFVWSLSFLKLAFIIVEFNKKIKFFLSDFFFFEKEWSCIHSYYFWVYLLIILMDGGWHYQLTKMVVLELLKARISLKLRERTQKLGQFQRWKIFFMLLLLF